jgi:hypothetical protein
MSLENRAAGAEFEIDSDQIYTGASIHYLYTPPVGERCNISDVIVSAEDAMEAQLIFMASGANTDVASNLRIKRRIYLAGNGGWVENRTLPIRGNADESIMFKIITASANATISVSGEHLR